MTFPGYGVALAIALSLCCSSAEATSQPSPAGADSAKKLFQAGKFPEAAEGYSRILAHSSQDYSALADVAKGGDGAKSAIVQLGRIALLSNRLTDAQKWLQKALALQPGDTDAKVMLAEAFHRADEFEKAADALDGIDVSTNQLIISQYPTLNTAKLGSFKGQTPYEVHGDGEITRLKFVKSDVLPVVTVRVNDSEEVTFFIDTGNSEVALDTDFAREVGAQLFGAVQGTFSGGEHTEVQNGRTDSITVGDWTVKNLPIIVLPLRQVSEGLGVKRIDGCIGTNLLYHFLATLDYRNGELVLRRKTAKGNKLFAANSSGKGNAVPFWIAGDHFMVGWGRVETIPPALLFVDTGLSGAGVKLAESVIKQAKITLEQDKATQGAGAGGQLTTVPYVVRRLSFGSVEENNVPGLYDGPFPWEETFGFHLAGMVGHDFFKRYSVTFDFEKMRIFLQ
jgi:Aspartyl protease